MLATRFLPQTDPRRTSYRNTATEETTVTRTATFDTATYKTGLAQEWQDAAPGWRRWHDPMEANEGSAAISRLLVDRAQLTSGEAVLDVGAGYGEPALTAARAVAPGGRVVLQDLSAQMLAFARERLAQVDLDDVEVAFHQGDAEHLDLPATSFDAVVSRAAIMYFVDVVSSLAHLRSLLRGGGRLAASVWGPPDRVGFAAPLPFILDALGLPPPPPERPGPFTLGDREQLATLVERAGFTEVETGTETAVWELPSRQAATRFLQDVAPPVTALFAGRPDEVTRQVWQQVTEQAWEPFVGADGQVRLPNEAIWVAAVNPT
jgi:enediyne biosynthesis protein CalE5